MLRIFVLFLFCLNLWAADSGLSETMTRFSRINDKTDPCPSAHELKWGKTTLDRVKAYQNGTLAFKCEEKIVDGCSYDQCVAPENLSTQYSEPFALLIPRGQVTPASYRMHFHGHSTYGNSYDKSLNSMIETFKFGVGTCKAPNEVLIIPYSEDNKCDDFHTHLPNKEKFDLFMNEIQWILRDNRRSPITLTGHSGAGKVISNILKGVTLDNQSDSAAARVEQLHLFDGLYSSKWADPIAKWGKRSQGEKISMYAGTSTPLYYSEALFKKLVKNPEIEESGTHEQTGHAFKLKSDLLGEFRLITEKPRGGLQHWELNRDYWANSYSQQ